MFTVGYPLFLRVLKYASGNPHAIPFAHWLALMFAAFVLLEGMAAAGYQRSTAICSAGTIVFGRAFLKFGPSILADSLACSLAIAAAGCFLSTATNERRRWSWIGLAVLTFLSYQTRPAYLFLVALWPLLGIFLDRLVVNRGAPWSTSFRRCGVYLAAMAIPFIAFCTVRQSVTGHWGLVSFGGYNAIGIAGQFLDQESIDKMPDDLKPLANLILERTKQLKDAEPPLSFEAMERMYAPNDLEGCRTRRTRTPRRRSDLHQSVAGETFQGTLTATSSQIRTVAGVEQRLCLEATCTFNDYRYGDWIVIDNASFGARLHSLFEDRLTDANPLVRARPLRLVNAKPTVRTGFAKVICCFGPPSRSQLRRQVRDSHRTRQRTVHDRCDAVDPSRDCGHWSEIP